jgi:hypothetical protein
VRVTRNQRPLTVDGRGGGDNVKTSPNASSQMEIAVVAN